LINGKPADPNTLDTIESLKLIAEEKSIIQQIEKVNKDEISKSQEGSFYKNELSNKKAIVPPPTNFKNNEQL